MSKIGNIYNSYGSQFNVSIANTYSYIVLSGNNLPSNSFIICSNTDDNNEDVGTYSLIMSDYEGNPVRLTYTIQEGNGLSFNQDILKLNVDNTFINNSYNLSTDISSIIDNNTLKYESNQLKVNIDNLSLSDENTLGVLKVDGRTITSDNGKIYVQTHNLDYADNGSNTYGIFSSNDESVEINNGIVSINTNMLKKCNENEFGVCKCDENTLYIKNGIKVNTKNLDRCSDKNFGIITGSDTIDIKDGIISVNNNLPIGDTNNNGILSFDGVTIIKNNENQLSVKEYNSLLNELSILDEKIIKINNTLKDMKQNILNGIS